MASMQSSLGSSQPLTKQQQRPNSFCEDLPRYFPEEGTYHEEVAHLAKAGFIQFPRDIERRREFFYSESMQHPAKANILMIERLVDYLSLPGETILDPMSGTGTLMMACLTGRNVVLLEDAAIFHYYQQESKKLFLERGVADGQILLLHGPCQTYLPWPMPVDHVIFSPPYSSVLNFEVKNAAQVAMGGTTYIREDGHSVFEDYKGTKDNLSRLNPFFYNQAMAKIYGDLIRSLRPGGTLTVIVQDLVQGGKRTGLSNWVMRTCVRQGVELLEWHCRYSPGTGFKVAMKAKGMKVVQNEDIIILKKPEV